MGPRDIRAELIRRGVTCAEVARECQVSKGLVSQVLNGKRHNPVVKKVVARHMGMSSREVFGDSRPSEEAS
jgi:lambda repressor-like predicted transcriptional regulator